ncbi:MAG TPA: CdaR family protein [Candidatus Limnocylindrales bacterium]|nr:CdaR family protein [Candidatus Limnocylindrales bacterium]
MRRALDFLVRNWPLKVGAIFLATILYSGLVLGQNVRTFNGTVPVEALRPPLNATLLSDLDPITQVRFRAPLDIGVISPTSFVATVDLAPVEPEPGGPTVDVPVTLTAIDQRITIVDYQPRTVAIRLDPVGSRELPITVSIVSAPDGLDLGPPQTDPSSVTIRGASSRVDAVTQVLARVSVDASGLNIDRDFDLVPIDANGNQVPNVELEPERARIRIAVARQLANRTLPVLPQIVGTPAAGYRIASVTVEPLVVTVSGEENIVTQMQTATTEVIDINGRTDDLEASVRVAVPAGASVSGTDTVRVLIVIDEDIGTRTLQIGVQMAGERSGFAYVPRTDRVAVTLGGPIAVLDAIVPSQLVALLDMASYATAGGEFNVPVEIEPPPGLEIVTIDPPEVAVFIAALPTSPSTVTPPSPTP